MARDKYLEKFIDNGFNSLKEDLKRIELSNAAQLRDMEQENTARHNDNLRRLDALEKDVGFVKWLCRVIGYGLTAIAAAVGIWKGVR